MSLRDRIAAVLLPDLEYAAAYNPHNRSPEDWAGDLADAVIANLGLRRENGELLHRWVTDWERPDYCNRCGIPHTTPCRREENR